MGQMKITGVRKIDKKLRQLGPKVSKKIMRKALREGQKKIMQKEVKANTPQGETGDMKKAVTVKAGGRSRVRMSVNVLFKEGLEDFYPRFVEFGAPERGIAPQGFMRKSYDSKKEELKTFTQNKILEIIKQEAKKK